MDDWREIATVDETMSTRQVAERVGVTPEHVALLCRQGKLDAVKVGREWLVYEGSVMRWLRTRKMGRPRKDERKPGGEQRRLDLESAE